MDSSAFNRLPVSELIGFFGVITVVGLVAILAWVIVGAVWFWRHVSILVH